MIPCIIINIYGNMLNNKSIETTDQIRFKGNNDMELNSWQCNHNGIDSIRKTT